MIIPGRLGFEVPTRARGFLACDACALRKGVGSRSARLIVSR